MAHDKHSHRDELPNVSHISNEETRHEESDVRIRPIVMFMVWLSVAAVVIHLLMAGLYNMLENREESKQGAPSPMASERNVIPPEPRLQLAPTEQNQGSPRFIEDHPLMDMKKLREEESQRLNGFGWVDQGAGVAKIPIGDAKRLLLESGALRSRAAAPQPQGSGGAAPQAETQDQGAGDGHASAAPPATQTHPGAGDRRPSRSSSGRRPQ
jgi:hypothetical protein